jgi:hypothetical protein
MVTQQLQSLGGRALVLQGSSILVSLLKVHLHHVCTIPTQPMTSPPSICISLGTPHQVTLVPTSADGGDRGNPVMLPPFQTPAATTAPWPSKDISAGSAVTPNSFVVNGIQQDRPGLMYVIAARVNDPNAQVGLQLPCRSRIRAGRVGGHNPAAR